jgi:hypothetical protein
MLEELQRRNYSEGTTRAFLQAVQQFAVHFGKSPDKLGPDDLRSYQAYLLVERKLAVASVVGRVAALGPFSAPASMADGGDSRSLYNTDGLRGYVPIPDGVLDPEYVGNTDPRDPVLSPINADLHNMPPTLLIMSERDLLLSATSSMSRAFAGRKAISIDSV